MNKYDLRECVRLKCFDCSCGQEVEVRECPVKSCANWPFRNAKTDWNGAEEPKFWHEWQKRKHNCNMTPEQKKAAGDRLRAFRAKR
jgi:hypothetical protein